MYHSIQIIPMDKAIFNSNGTMNGRNTWTNWHLIPESRPVIHPPEFKSNYADISGANGSVDLSTVLTNYPVFNDREGSIDFYVMNGYKEWYNAYSDIMEYCHGQKVRLIFDDEPSYYYSGRVMVNEWRSEKDWSKIVLDYHVDPYKYELFSTLEDWRWDPFSFVDGIIRNYSDYKDVAIHGDGDTVVYSVVIPLRAMPVVPEFTIQASTANTWINLIKYKSDNTSIALQRKITLPDTSKHIYRIYNFKLTGTETKIGFTAQSDKNFTVSINYRGGRL